MKHISAFYIFHLLYCLPKGNPVWHSSGHVSVPGSRGSDPDGNLGQDVQPSGIWQPEPGSGMTQEQFLATWGMGYEKFNRVRALTRQLKKEISETFKRRNLLPDDTDEFFDDMLFTESQLEFLLETNANRRKRKLVNFENSPFLKWDSFPISYAIDEVYSEKEKDQIRASIAHWESNTCIRFQEYSDTSAISGHYMLFTFTNSSKGSCWSYVGMVDEIFSPQIVHLRPSCFQSKLLGIIIHEIGHAIGFFHEHNRHDRDTYITVLEANIKPEWEYAFRLKSLNVASALGVEYDLGSKMHYTAKAFSIGSQPTLMTVDPLYQNTMGQSHGLSFFDSKLANMAYCPAEDHCDTRLHCERGGYQDPNNCVQCRCPEGFGGQHCERVQDSVGDKCAASSVGVVDVTSAQETCIVFFNYNNQGADLSCNWHLKAPSGCHVEFRFSENAPFGIKCGGYCHHYVEVKYTAGLRTRGPRFCCHDTPDFNGKGKLTSEENEMMINFRSPLPHNYALPGFAFCYRLADADCLQTAPTRRRTITAPTMTRQTATTRYPATITTRATNPPTTRRPPTVSLATRTATAPNIRTTVPIMITTTGTPTMTRSTAAPTTAKTTTVATTKRRTAPIMTRTTAPIFTRTTPASTTTRTTTFPTIKRTLASTIRRTKTAQNSIRTTPAPTTTRTITSPTMTRTTPAPTTTKTITAPTLMRTTPAPTITRIIMLQL